ncbi:MAG: flagellar basal body P-ring protein FlgI [Spirochaetia bacterium]|nr:flagellar basal body P-ring protein FlgI [Spirochaetia bacterium]
MLKKYSLLIFIFIFSFDFLYSLTLSIGEITRISSFRENHLVGFGLVVGLKQTGDSRNLLGKEALIKFLNNKGIKIDPKNLKSRNIAAVMVMAKAPPLSKAGDNIDIWISSIGDAKSIENGYLVQTPLYGADGNIYAVAQSFLSSVQNDKKTRNNQNNTVFALKGAIIERPVIQSIISQNKENLIELSMINFDINTANNIVGAINSKYSKAARLQKDSVVSINIPQNKDPINFLAELLEIQVEVVNRAKIVIDSKSGTIIIGGGVGMSAIAVKKDGISINIQSSEDQKDNNGDFVYMGEKATVKQLVENLNALGLSTAAIIDIIKSIHTAGALHADLIIN